MHMSNTQVDTTSTSTTTTTKQGMKCCLPTASAWIIAVWHCSVPEARFSAPPLQSFHPSLHLVSPPLLSSCLINGPVCFTRSRQGAWRRDKTIISLAAAAHAGAPTADRILKQAAVLSQIAAQLVLTSPLSNTSPLWWYFSDISLQGTNIPKLIFQGYCVSMSDKIYPVLGKTKCLFSQEGSPSE